MKIMFLLLLFIYYLYLYLYLSYINIITNNIYFQSFQIANSNSKRCLLLLMLKLLTGAKESQRYVKTLYLLNVVLMAKFFFSYFSMGSLTSKTTHISGIHIGFALKIEA